MTLRCFDGHEQVEWADNDAACWLCGGDGERCWASRSNCEARGPVFREDVA